METSDFEKVLSVRTQVESNKAVVSSLRIFFTVTLRDREADWSRTPSFFGDQGAMSPIRTRIHFVLGVSIGFAKGPQCLGDSNAGLISSIAFSRITNRYLLSRPALGKTVSVL